MNEKIRALKVLVIDDAGVKVGVMMTRDAVALAKERGLDLVEVSPESDPPVCRIMDYGKHLYVQQKREREARKKQVVQHVKEVKFRVKTENHDLQTKLRHIRGFLEEHDKVKLTVRFRGREMAHTDLGFKVLDKLIHELEDLGAPEFSPKLEGRSVITMLAPLSKSQIAAREKAKAQAAKGAGPAPAEKPPEKPTQGETTSA